MPDLIASRTVVAREPHRCRSCGAVSVQPGEAYHRETLAHDGQIYDWVSCEPCDAIFPFVCDKWSIFADEGVSAEDFVEWAEDHRDDEVHGQAAREFLARREAAR